MQYLWKRWSTEYLHNIHQRTKWTAQHEILQPGKLVLIKEATPPLEWQIAIVETLHPGADGLIRVTSVRTPAGIINVQYINFVHFQNDVCSVKNLCVIIYSEQYV